MCGLSATTIFYMLEWFETLLDKINKLFFLNYIGLFIYSLFFFVYWRYFDTSATFSDHFVRWAETKRTIYLIIRLFRHIGFAQCNAPLGNQYFCTLSGDEMYKFAKLSVHISTPLDNHFVRWAETKRTIYLKIRLFRLRSITVPRLRSVTVSRLRSATANLAQ